MTVFVSLLRAVNVGGTGKLPMRDLKAMCEGLGFAAVQTYIASGNVVFDSGHAERRVRALLERALADYAGRPVGVFVRTAAEMAAVLAENPFPDADPRRTAAIFLAATPGPDALDGMRGADGEAVALGRREIYVHYVNGMGRSKLRIPAAEPGTARNMNTVAKLAALATGR